MLFHHHYLAAVDVDATLRGLVIEVPCKVYQASAAPTAFTPRIQSR